MKHFSKNSENVDKVDEENIDININNMNKNNNSLLVEDENFSKQKSDIFYYLTNELNDINDLNSLEKDNNVSMLFDYSATNSNN
jgi:hypothetical protein